MKKLIAVILSLLLLSLSLLPALAQEESADKRYVRISIRDYGDIYAELYPDTAPITVENFMRLVNSQFYDGLTFHRIISGFMIQGGDPLGNGTGGSPDKIKGEFSSNGVDNPLLHERGVLSMARSGDPDSASSQFFIMHQVSPHLDGSYAAFGRVVSGMGVVDRICQSAPVQDNNGTVLKEDQPVMESIREVTEEEALAAAEKEKQNGLSGTDYVDPLSDLSFPVPQGWNLISDEAGQAVFASDTADLSIVALRLNQWDALPAAYKQQFATQGVTRQDMDTSAFKKSALLQLIGLEDDAAVQEETHSGILFYTYEAAQGDLAAVYQIGAKNAYIYLFVFSASAQDAAYPDFLSILDQLRFQE